MTTLFISHSSKDKDWAERTHRALSRAGYEAFLDSHPDDGIHTGADWEKTLYRRLRQSRGVIVLCTANWLASPWCVAEAIIAREQGKRIFMLAGPDVGDDRQIKGPADGAETLGIPGFLRDRQLASLAGVTEAQALRSLLHGLEKEGLKDAFKLPPEGPYPGLRPFEESDAAVFFGRDEQIEHVLSELTRHRRVNAKRFIVVLGASGCGKSSLVRAGVLPRLRRASEKKGSSEPWLIPPPFPAGEGLDGLARSLAHAFKAAGQSPDFRSIRRRLEGAEDLSALASELLVVRGLANAYLLIVLDQLEEIFGTPERPEARAALRLLLDASADTASRLVVLATMRSDFLNAFQLFPGAAERYEGIPLDPMPSDRFAELIERPADLFGLLRDPGLSERMANETGFDDALPLLAFTLKTLHAKCGEDGPLTLRAYQELGGVFAAIKHVADEIMSSTGYAGLPADDPRMRDLRRTFYSLARVGEEGQFARRIARWSQMPPSCKGVLDRFVQQRLLVSGTEDGEPTLNVAHEALFRVWDTLRHWLLQDRKALALRSQIEDAAAEWDTKNRAENRKWPEERILDAVRDIGLSGVSLDDVACPGTVRAFLGPTDPEEISTLPSLTEAQDGTAGSGRYDDAWRLPLGHEARASVGVRLALLGDSRRGVGLQADGLPDIDWCGIDGGAVAIAIRSDPDNPNSDVVDIVTRDVDPFGISRYPVTIAQFQAFFVDCHQDDKWRLPPGFPVDLPADYPPPKHRKRHGNHPANTVSWYDAAAFCHWLGARQSERYGTEFKIRLPTEFEWQLAATGGDSARNYPWGPDWEPQQEPWRANTVESGLNRSTAVGLYPLGASQAGVLDMAGTIYEWCRNAFDDPDNTGFPKTQGPRVRRGGSWVSSQVYARCAFRVRFSPLYRDGNLGFRVVCSSPIVEP